MLKDFWSTIFIIAAIGSFILSFTMDLTQGERMIITMVYICWAAILFSLPDKDSK